MSPSEETGYSMTQALALTILPGDRAIETTANHEQVWVLDNYLSMLLPHLCSALEKLRDIVRVEIPRASKSLSADLPKEIQALGHHMSSTENWTDNSTTVLEGHEKEIEMVQGEVADLHDKQEDLEKAVIFGYGGWSFTRKAHSNGKNKFQAKVWYSQKGFHTLPAYLNYLNNIILWKNLPAGANWKQYGITVFSKPYQGTMMDEDKISCLLESITLEDIELDRVHKVFGPRSHEANRPRDVLFRVHFFTITEDIIRKVWKIKKVDFDGVFNSLTTGGTLHPESLMAFITVLLKEGKDPTNCQNYRPISLFNIDIKVFAKVLANRLTQFIPDLIQLDEDKFIVWVYRQYRNPDRDFEHTIHHLNLSKKYATFPWMYIVSDVFPSSDIAFISYISTNCTLGVCTMLLTFLPRLLAEISNIETLTNIHNILKWVFLIFPQFCLGNGLMELTLRQMKFDLINSFGIDSYISPFQMDVLGWTFTAMATQGSILFLLRLLLNGQSFQRKRHELPLYDSSDDMDVETERGRVLGGMTPNDILLLSNLRKSYQNNIVVKDICLGIKAGECFGLLGVNGAGKSTLFKMLIGEINPTCGKAIIRSSKGKEVSIKSAYNEDIIIGYCPQNDALNNFLTGREHLYYYCKLHGISNKDIHKVSSVLSHRLTFDEQIDKLVGTYSRGTKRKLLMAIALIGKPHILLLDEPSSGMDPWSKRHLWEAIKQEVHDGCAVVFTSHSMEECEALCTRLTIMINGDLKCIGPVQHIKNRFGHGYSVTLWLNADYDCAHSVITYFKSHFPEVNVKDHHLNILECHIPNQHGYLDKLFQVLESMKTQLQIKNYSVTQTTLDQVFIQFAAQQEQYLNPIMKRSMDNLTQHLPA
ncbi:ATP-binding cassette sub-family A member 13-like [Mantella aurantiaca]